MTFSQTIILEWSKIMVSEKTIQIVKATVPVLREKGEEITKRMYQIAFEERPEYKRFFTTTWMQHADGGPQVAKLAQSVIDYANHIDELDKLKSAVQHIAHRHTDSRVIAEQYPVIGACLLQAIKDVLQDAATPEIMEAWAEAYQALAEIFIATEKQIYREEDKELVAKLSQ